MGTTSSILPGLIVNADDLGIHPNINTGIMSAYRDGIVTSATMLMTTPYLAETINQVRASTLPVGIHLSLTLGKAVAERNDVHSLVDEEGTFKWSSPQLLLSLFASQKGHPLLSQIRCEFEAQLSLALDYGLRLTHADSHQHVHMHPRIYSAVEELLPRYGIKRLRYSRELVSPKAVLGVMKQAKYINFAKVALLRWISRGIQPQIETTDRFFGVLYSGVITKQALSAQILALRDDRSLEVCIHPGFPMSGQDTAYSPADNSFISSPWRQLEHDVLIDPEIVALVRQRGLVLRSFDGREKPL